MRALLSWLLPHDWRHRLAALAGVLCLLALAEINGEALNLRWLRNAPNHVQFGLLVAGIGLLVAGLGGISTQRKGAGTQSRKRLISFVGLSALILLGFAVRVWRLEEAVHFYVDEGSFVEGVTDIQRELHVKMLTPFHYIAQFSYIYPYLQAGSVGIFGANLHGIRMLSVALGVLTIPALYQLGRVLFNWRVGLVAAALLAAFPPHIHFSRLGLNNIADPLFGVLALAGLAYGRRTGSRAFFVIGGACLGLTQYFYEGGRLLFPALAVLWLLLTFTAWRGRWRGALLAMLVAVLVAMPVYYTLALWDLPAGMRLNQQVLAGDYWLQLLLTPSSEGLLGAHLREKILNPLLHYVSLPEGAQFYYGGETALLLPFMLPFFAAGLFAVWWRHRLVGALLVLWLLLTVLGNSLVRDSLYSARYVVALPALVLLVAYGLWAVFRWLRRFSVWQTWRRMAVPLVMAMLLTAQVVYYFGLHLPVYNRLIRPNHDQQDVVFRARALPPGTQVYLVSDDYDIFMPLLHLLVDFWGLDMPMQHLYYHDFAEDHILENMEDIRGYAFFVEQDDVATLMLLRETLGEAQASFSPYNVPREKQYVMLYYPPRLEDRL